MPGKRKTNETNAPSPKRARATTTRANGAKRRRDVKVVKIPNPRGGRGCFTIIALPGAKNGDRAVIDGKRYTVRSERQLRALIKAKKWRAVESTCTSRVTSMFELFTRSDFNGNIAHWDTSHVVDMGGMFKESSVFNSPIGGWDVGRVRDMSFMFSHAHAFDQDLGKWNTSSVRNMKLMFNTAKVFNRPIENWDVSLVKNMTSLFANAGRFNQNLGRWNVRNVTHLDLIFYNATMFNGRNTKSWGSKLNKLESALKAFDGARKTPAWWYEFMKKKSSMKKTDHNPIPRRGRKKALMDWTTNDIFPLIQNHRMRARHMNTKKSPRNVPSKEVLRTDYAKEVLRTNRAIAQFMRNSGVKTPEVPMQIGMTNRTRNPTYLYRGICGEEADQLRRNGYLSGGTYISFSRSLAIARNRFTNGRQSCVVLRLKFSDLPHGIPLVWFSDSSSVCQRVRGDVMSSCDEQEVLFPPGTITLSGYVPGYDPTKDFRMVNVSYTPDTESKSLEGKQIIRRIGPAIRDVTHKPDRYEREVSNMFSKLFLK